MKGGLPYWEKCFLVTLIFLGKKGLSPFPESTLPSVTNQLVHVDRHQQTLCFVHFSMLRLLNQSHFPPKPTFWTLIMYPLVPCTTNFFIHSRPQNFISRWVNFHYFPWKILRSSQEELGSLSKIQLIGPHPQGLWLSRFEEDYRFLYFK